MKIKLRTTIMVMMVCLMIILFPPQSDFVNVQSPQHSSSQIFNANTVYIYENTTIIFDFLHYPGVSVPASDTWILKNTTIYMKIPKTNISNTIYTAYFRVYGNLTMINSTITAYNESYPYHFEVKSGGKLIMKGNSTISEARSYPGDNSPGINIESNTYFYMNNSIIQDCSAYSYFPNYYAGVSIATNNCTIENSIFRRIYGNYKSILISGANITVINCSFADNTYGVKLYSENATFIRCSFSDTDLMTASGKKNITIIGNRFINGATIYVSSTENLTIRDSYFADSQYAIYMTNPANVTLVNNTIQAPNDGICIISPMNVTLTENKLFNSSIIVEGSLSRLKSLNLNETNLVNNLPIQYIVNESDLNIENDTIGELILAYTSNVTIHNLTSSVLYFYYSNDIRISDVVSKFGNFGFYAFMSNNISAINHEVSNTQSPTPIPAYYMYSCYNVTLNNIWVHDAVQGISIYNAHNFTILNSRIHNIQNGAGLAFSSTNNATALNNEIVNAYIGIKTYNGKNITFSGNSLENCSFFFENMNLDSYKTINLDSSNTVNGKPVQFYFNRTDPLLLKNNNAFGQIILVYAPNFTADNLIIPSLFLQDVDNVSIVNSKFSFSSYGAYITDSSSAVILWSSFSYNLATGLYLKATNATVMYNNFTNNGLGMEMNEKPSINVTIHLNNFINNTVSAKSSSSSAIIWYYNHLGNYWSDYPGSDNNIDGIGDTPYTFSDNQDPYPIMWPIHIVELIGNDRIVISSISQHLSPEFSDFLIVELRIISDLDIIRHVLLQYHVDGTVENVSMTYDGENKYYCYVPAQPLGTTLNYEFLFLYNQTWYSSKTYSFTFTNETYDTPNILNVSYPSSVYVTESIPISVNVSSSTDISKVVIYYLSDSVWLSKEMTLDLQDNLYKYVFTNLTSGDFSFFIYVENKYGISNKTMTYNITVIDVDLTPPTILSVSWTPSNPYAYENITVYVSATDDKGVDLVILSWNINNTWYNKTMALNDSTVYVATLQGLGVNQTLLVKAYAKDTDGNWAVSGVYAISFIEKTIPTNGTGPTHIFTEELLPQTIIVIILSFIFGAIVVAVIMKKRKK